MIELECKSKFAIKSRSEALILILGLLNAKDRPVSRWIFLNSLVFATSSKPILDAVSFHLVVRVVLLDILGDSWLLLEVSRLRAWSELHRTGHHFELRDLMVVQLSKWLVFAALQHPLLLGWIKLES